MQVSLHGNVMFHDLCVVLCTFSSFENSGLCQCIFSSLLQIAISNPFVFKHISNLRGMDHFDDVGPSVVMASPGMMQSGLSRDLFESWCTDRRNGTIIAGYCVEGTLAKVGC